MVWGARVYRHGLGECGVGHYRGTHKVIERGTEVLPIVLVLLLVVIFAGLGFALHVLWIIAAVLFVLWLVGFALGKGENAGRRSWYRW
jgi:membrane protein YdbS with pleckstrin-like domain